MRNSTLLIAAAASLSLISCASMKKKDQHELPVISMQLGRELTLAKPLEVGRRAHVSAASGLIKIANRFYVAADDENSIFSFAEGDKVLTPITLAKQKLPADYKERKAVKPDIESIAELTPKQWPPYGAIVAWPSASMPNRTKAFVLPLGKNQKPQKAQVVDISQLAKYMQVPTNELNIEGILVLEDKVMLFQRGNSAVGENGVVEIALSDWLQGMKTGKWTDKFTFQSIKMGKLSGVKVGFSDVATTKYGLLALGSAEDTQSAYQDGQVYGTVLALITGNEARILGRFDPIAKLEGIYVHETGEGLELYLVEDSDSADKPSRLFTAKLPSSLLKN